MSSSHAVRGPGPWVLGKGERTERDLARGGAPPGPGDVGLPRPSQPSRAVLVSAKEPGNVLLGALHLRDLGRSEHPLTADRGQRGQVVTLTATAVFPRSIWPARHRTTLDGGKAVSWQW